MKVAVVAHSGKSFGGGLTELRDELHRRGIRKLRWREVSKSREAGKHVAKAIAWGADVIFVWGGDGTAQRAIDAAAGSGIPLALLPAGTANLLATNIGVPQDVAAAVEIGLEGERRAMDIGRINGEAFAVMAGAGFDARMIDDADGALKDRFGRFAYVWTGLKNLRVKPFDVRVNVDGAPWFSGAATCVLVGNVSQLFGGVALFDGARDDDGLLEVGVLAAEGPLRAIKTVAQVVVGSADTASNAQTARAGSVRIKMKQKVPYQVDGGSRKKVTALRVDVVPGGVVVCAPSASPSGRVPEVPSAAEARPG